MFSIWSRPKFILCTKSQILYFSKLKEFAENKINVTQILEFVWGSIENFVGNGENAGYQHFLLFPLYF